VDWILRKLILVTLTLMWLGLTGPISGSAAKEARSSSPERYLLGTAELREKLQGALLGDPKAAWDLSMHYEVKMGEVAAMSDIADTGWVFDVRKIPERQKKQYLNFRNQRLFWLRIGLENGNLGSMSDFASELIGEGTYTSCLRAKYFFHKLLDTTKPKDTSLRPYYQGNLALVENCIAKKAPM
jgi:hypothetical protein